MTSIAARATDQHIRVCTALDQVAACKADQQIPGTPTDDQVISIRADLSGCGRRLERCELLGELLAPPQIDIRGIDRLGFASRNSTDQLHAKAQRCIGGNRRRCTRAPVGLIGWNREFQHLTQSTTGEGPIPTLNHLTTAHREGEQLPRWDHREGVEVVVGIERCAIAIHQRTRIEDSE